LQAAEKDLGGEARENLPQCPTISTIAKRAYTLGEVNLTFSASCKDATQIADVSRLPF